MDASTPDGARIDVPATDIPFVQLLGFELLHASQGRSVLHFAAQPEHLNSHRVTHGGALMTLLDATMAAAARSVQPDMGVVTIEMKTSFMRAATPSSDAPLVARGELLHRSATLAFTQATVLDASGRACAHATATFKYVRGLATGGRNVARETLPSD